jgi:hypothetical protein
MLSISETPDSVQGPRRRGFDEPTPWYVFVQSSAIVLLISLILTPWNVMMALHPILSDGEARGRTSDVLVESFGVLFEIEVRRLSSLQLPMSAVDTDKDRGVTHFDLDELSLVSDLNILVLGLHLVLLAVQLGSVRLNLTTELRLLLVDASISRVRTGRRK